MAHVDTYGCTPQSLTRNGSPWFPFMGEIHYSRYPQQYWKESLLKMKAGGVNVVSSYVIWIHHEEIEGEWDFTGCRDLHAFVRLIGECGMKMILRIGPWCHGEVRNGGFPDWLLQKDFHVRTNDTGYLEQVRIFYAKIYEQVKGLLAGDGGPIIGVQIENEYGHCGGMTGAEGEKHMRTLKAMAEEAGFKVPLYTATGWGGAVTAGMIPVMGGYVDAPWDQRLTELPPSGNFVFTHERNDHNIGNDFGSGSNITFDIDKFPYLTAELGGGLQVTCKRRPVAEPDDIGAMTTVKLGSGVNLLGYYMYHGGTNPKGKLTTLQESTSTGYLNDLPELSYDFRAPVREYGQISDTYRVLKLYSLFVHDFGSTLCTLDSHIPQDNPQKPGDITHLRYAWRYNEACKENGGYLFVNNYIRHQNAPEYKGHVFTVPAAGCAGGSQLSFPPADIHNGDYFFLPFNLAIGNAVLETSLASPLCILHGGDYNSKPVYVFYRTPLCTGKQDSELYSFKDGRKPSDADILTLSKETALNAYKVSGSEAGFAGGEYLIISSASVTVQDHHITFAGRDVSKFASYPALPRIPKGFTESGEENGCTVYTLSKPSDDPAISTQVEIVPESKTETTSLYTIQVPSWQSGTSDAAEPGTVTIDDNFLSIYYTGSSAKLFENSRLVADNLYVGQKHPWRVGLKRFCPETGDKAKTFRLEITALKEGEQVFLEDWPPMVKGKACKLSSIYIHLEYRVQI